MPEIAVEENVTFNENAVQNVEVTVVRSDKIFVELDGENKNLFSLDAIEYNVVGGVVTIPITLTS